MALGLVLGLLGSFYYLSKAPKLYEATSTLLVKDSAGAAFEGQRQEDDLVVRESIFLLIQELFSLL